MVKEKIRSRNRKVNLGRVCSDCLSLAEVLCSNCADTGLALLAFTGVLSFCVNLLFSYTFLSVSVCVCVCVHL